MNTSLDGAASTSSATSPVTRNYGKRSFYISAANPDINGRIN